MWLLGGVFKKGDKLILKKKDFKNVSAFVYGKNRKFFNDQLKNKVNYKNFDNLKKYYSKGQIIDIVSVISLFGYLNRWNDTLGTVLEGIPEEFVEDNLKPLGWI